MWPSLPRPKNRNLPELKQTDLVSNNKNKTEKDRNNKGSSSQCSERNKSLNNNSNGRKSSCRNILTADEKSNRRYYFDRDEPIISKQEQCWWHNSGKCNFTVRCWYPGKQPNHYPLQASDNYTGYHESRLIRSGDVETQPGPVRRNKTNLIKAIFI